MNCSFCQPTHEYSWLHIKNYTFWHVELRSQQNYLGWCFVVLNRHVTDLMEIAKAEQDELFLVTRSLRDALKKQFNPDSFNYASLGNVTSHLHLQVVPRYKQEVNFEGVVFKDDNWGKNYSPYDKDFDVSRDIKLKILELIKSELK